ncbi:MAG: thioesterase family protein [Coprococcus sp.]
MEAGIKNEKSIVVTEDVTASKVGSGLLPVYATPSMIALMEGTCAESVQSELVEGEGTVGVSVDIKHIAATPIGMKVRCESLLKEVNGKKLVFEVNVYDEKGLIGTGTHKRQSSTTKVIGDWHNHDHLTRAHRQVWCACLYTCTICFSEFYKIIIFI